MPAASVLLVPGFNGSGHDHWQSRWHVERRDCRRLEQRSWDDPDPASWCATLEAAVTKGDDALVLVGHSLGCATIAHWVASGGSIAAIAGALLVAPCDVERPGLPAAITRFAPMPTLGLPFRSTLVASSDDAYASIDRARQFAADWGSAFVEAGRLGHINSASGLGAWDFGQMLLDALLASAHDDRTPYRRAAVLRSNGAAAAAG